MQVIKHYRLTVLCIIGILVAILLPGSDVPSVGIPNIDKVVHFTMFAVVTGCYDWEYKKYHAALPLFLMSSISFILFGLSTEIMQYFVPGRSCDMVDLAVDAIGILSAGCFMRYYLSRGHHKK